MKYTPSVELVNKVTKGTLNSLQQKSVEYRKVVDEQFMDKFEALSQDLTAGLSAGSTLQGVTYQNSPLRSLTYIQFKAKRIKKSVEYTKINQQRKLTGKSAAYALGVIRRWKSTAKPPSFKVLRREGRKGTVELMSGYDLSKDTSFVQSLLEGVKYPDPLPSNGKDLAVVLYSEYKKNMTRPLLTTGSKKFQGSMADKLKTMFNVRSS